MRTSATGKVEGFTLVELLIVLTILGLLTAAVVVAMPDGSASLRGEAERFAARAKAAQDRAIVEGRVLALAVNRDGYELRRRRGREWERLDAARWEEGISARDQRTILLDPTGLAVPAEVVLRRGDDEAAVDFAADGGIRVRG